MENLVENKQFYNGRKKNIATDATWPGDLRDELDHLNLCFSLQSCTKNSTCGIGVAWIWIYKKKKKVEGGCWVKQTIQP